MGNRKCDACGFEDEIIRFLNYSETNYPSPKCPECGSGNVVGVSSQQKDIPSGILCPFCSENEAKFFSFNSSGEDIYLSENLICCEGCKELLRKRVISYNGIVAMLPISTSSLGSFIPKYHGTVKKFLKKIIKTPRRIHA